MGKDAGGTASLGALVRQDRELRKTLAQLESENTLLRAQMELSLDGILMVDSDWQIITANERFFEMWGIPENLPASHNDGQSIRILIDKVKEPERFQATLEELMQDSAKECRDVLELMDGRWLERYSAPIHDKVRSVIGRVCYFRDVTELKLARKELDEQKETLENRVKERTEEMLVLNQDLLSRESECLQQQKELEAMNISLRTLLSTVEEEKRHLESKTVSNFRDALLPFLEMLGETQLTSRQQHLLDTAKEALANVISAMNLQLCQLSTPLTPTEIRVANCIRAGKSSKEIAVALTCSERTVEGHRQSIRRKLGLAVGDNLLTHLLALD